MNIRSSFGRLTEAKQTHVNKSKRCGYIFNDGTDTIYKPSNSKQFCVRFKA